MSDPTEFNASIMERALELAAEAEAVNEVPVGAVVFDPVNEKVIAEAHNLPIASCDPSAHAEMLALRQAGKAVGNYRLMGFDLYVTLEPCTMCASAISHARIRRLVFAAQDKKGGAVLNGVRFFEASTCHWKPEVIHAEAHSDRAGQILRNFFANRRRRL